MMNEHEEYLLVLYAKLHDGLSDMVESGRLTEADIPDDYQWLVEALAEGVVADQAVKDHLDD
jgi:hypothetical protein